MIRIIALAAAALLCLGMLAQADVFNMETGLTSLEMVTVGDPGNAPDIRYSATVYGAVNYTYRIGRFEVTAAQYTEFLNAKAKSDPYGLYSTDMTSTYGCKIERLGSDGDYRYIVGSDWANRPANYVSYWDSLRFANWLNNGQGNGDTETGAYTLSGYDGYDGREIRRNDGAKWFITSEDEWYKAAYYKGGGTRASYWLYPTQSDYVPDKDLIYAQGTNCANYYSNPYESGLMIGSPYYQTVVGTFLNSVSAFGTYDQGGNVWEWNEAVPSFGEGYSFRGMRGGSFNSDYYALQSAHSNAVYPTYEGATGFRLVAVPEPSSILFLASGLGAVVTLRRRGWSDVFTRR